MRRVARSGVATLVLAAALALGGAPGPAPAAAQRDPGPRYPECVDTSGGVQVLMMIDISESLQTSDPSNRRGAFVQAWLTSMIGLAEAGRDVRVSIAGYGSRWLPVVPWQDVDPSRPGELLSQARALGRSDYDTDHALGLLRAAESLSEEARRVEEDGGAPCTMLVWFTDGEYSFSTNSQQFRSENGLPATTPYSDLPVTAGNIEAIMDAGLDLLCRSPQRSPVQALRNDNTAIVAVALGAGVDFRLVDELATGEGFDGPNAPCNLPPYDGGTLDQIDPDDVIHAPVADDVVEVPELTDVATFGLTLEGDASIERLEIETPDGAEIVVADIEPGSSTVGEGGYELDLFVGDAASTVDVVATNSEDGPLPGTWRFVVIPSEPSPVQVLPAFRSSIAARVDEDPEIEYGTAESIDVTLVDGSGRAVDELPADLDLQVLTPDDTELEVRRVGDRFEVEIPAEATTVAGDALVLDATPQTSSDLEFQTSTLRLPVRRPEYPSVTFPDAEDGVVRRGIVETPATVRIPYTVEGPSDGRGCVVPTTNEWPDSETIDASIAYPSDEVCLGPGESRPDELEIEIDERIEARECRVVSFDLEPEADGLPARTQEQRVCLTLERGPTFWTRLLAILAGLGGVLLPFVGLGVFNYVNGRLPNGISTARRNVVLTAQGVGVADRNGLFDRRTSFQPTRPSSSHSLDLGGGMVVVTRAMSVPRSGRRGRFSFAMLLTGPRTYLLPTGQSVVIGSRSDKLFGGTLSEPVEAPRNIHNLWVVSADPTPTVQAIRVAGGTGGVYELVDDIRLVVAGSVSDLVDEVESAPDDMSEL